MSYTKGKWYIRFLGDRADLISAYGIFAGIDWGSGAPDMLDAEDFEEWTANANRIVSCVNGCEGINPDAVKDMYEALKGFERIRDSWLPQLIDEAYKDEVKALHLTRNIMIAALNKADGK